MICTRGVGGGGVLDQYLETKNSEITYPVFRTTLSILVLEQTRTNHAHWLGQTYAKLYTLCWTDSCEIIYPV